MFNFGFGELVMILLIVVAVFGGIKLPGLGESIERFRAPGQDIDRPRLLLRRSAQRWTLSEWFLFGAAIVLAAAVIANALLQARHGR